MSTIRPALSVRTHRPMFQWIAGLTALLATCACAYYWMFARFSNWDDDGYLLIGIRSLLKGHRLYDDIYTQYGPFYYLVYGAAHWVASSLSGQPVSHDVQRYIGVALWVFSAMLCARTVWLLTGSLVWAGFGLFLGVKLLGFFPWSAGHPEEVCMALLAAITVIACGMRPAAARGRVAALACLVAAVVLTKVNAGLYIGLAVCLFLLRASARTRWQRAAEFLVIVASLALPAALMSSMFDFDWVRNYAMVATVSIGTAMLVAHETESELYMTGRIWRNAALWFLACTVLVILPFFLRGTTLRALLQMTVLQHAGTARNWFLVAPIGSKVLLWTAVSMGALAIAHLPGLGAGSKEPQPAVRTPDVFATPERAASATGTRSPGFRSPGFPGWVRIGMLGLKIAIGLICLFVLGTTSLRANHPTIFNYCLPFVWLLLAEPSDETARRTRGGRMALCLLAAFTYLYAFPVAGAQILFASVPAGLAAIVILRDGTAGMADSLPLAWLPPKVLRAGPWIACALLAALFSRELYAGYRTYTGNVSLALPGATNIRVKPQEAATYQWIARHVDSCSALYSMPGQFSLNFWTLRESPTELTAGNWVGLLNATQQQAVIRDLSRYPGLCIVYNPQLVEVWRRGQDLSRSLLAQYIHTEFVTVAASDGYFIMKRKSATPPR